MANLSTYGANALLNGTPMPATLYLAGFLGNPTAAANANLAAETRRIATTRNAAAGGSTATASGGTITNAAATEAWTHFGLFDAATGGNPWWIGAFPVAVPVIITQTVRLSSGIITLTFSIWS